ncbi:hypothetical protein [Salicibibacter kimchii]|uniref:Uncharacterized protein n=1 Tax=Salicibibacter kimchii TaxID=2099786 RepID=A0A345BWJ0_9BACI|nr:hypothetical protein [Salicibibacter kimchii]AXF55321.1 hypothetical protein DT065_04310 [Salicibibacter kimchii]
MTKDRDFSKMTDGELAHYIDTELNGVYAVPHESEEDREETRRIMKEIIEKYRSQSKGSGEFNLKEHESKSSK